MEGWRSGQEILVMEGWIKVPYRWSAGIYGSRFLSELRDNCRFVGVRCSSCGKAYVPPRRVCGPCFRELTELVPVSDEGEVMTFTVVSFGFVDPSTGMQKPVPYGYAVIKLDDADTYILHCPDETDPRKIKVGPGEGGLRGRAQRQHARRALHHPPINATFGVGRSCVAGNALGSGTRC